MTEARTLLASGLTSALYGCRDVPGLKVAHIVSEALSRPSIIEVLAAAAEADILRERVAALEGAARRVTSAQVYEAPGDPCQGLDVGFVRALRLLYEVVTSPAPTPATDPRQRKENVGGPAVAAYFATPATDEARCVGCHERGIDHPRDTEHPYR